MVVLLFLFLSYILLLTVLSGGLNWLLLCICTGLERSFYLAALVTLRLTPMLLEDCGFGVLRCCFGFSPLSSCFARLFAQPFTWFPFQRCKDDTLYAILYYFVLLFIVFYMIFIYFYSLSRLSCFC